MGQSEVILYQVSVWLIPILLAITLHEAAHGFAALYFGDDTAYRAGRVSLNPLRHVDPFGTILIPALLLFSGSPILFGYAKPVPVNFGRLRRPRRDMVWVAAAGPGMNLALATVSAILIHVVVLAPPAAASWIADNLENAIFINVLLAVFNMIPLPPLDGGRVAVGLLPDVLARPLARLERFGLAILIGALFLLPLAGRELGYDINILRWLVGVPSQALIELIATVTGHG
jgi:Zn-dependent protease